ncbi:oxidoreductase [Levilactobacillus spicheri]|uniref:Short-chain dehydrogenase n=2 Tax=Levilactobacillus spicheri TaxID=216463 RepID=A0A0F3RW70_9LACO|nr:oxidoreductase [Levilactobacillus spicheri]KJW13829.1 short-chain dehydrogenase [Levilactobacillus spicheri]KRL47079.1 short chain dehydrogenase [Levilactobacillus spicheri DSM 15429]GEO67007.1 short-chain dehydrogenase/reductase [Levilactobacillus spicheri]
MHYRQVALVTGASSGIGNAIAKSLHRNGVTVYAGARRVDRMNDLDDLGITTLALDVTDADSVERVVDRIVTETGRIDILVNNAGFGLLGALEDLSIDQAQAQFDVNLFGAARLIQSVLPMMRQQHAGRIINVTSVDGKVAQPMASWYVASKFALEGLSDTLRLELAPHGVHVAVVEPGSIQSEWADIASDHLQTASGSGPYAATTQTAIAILKAVKKFASAPQVIARLVDQAALSRRPKTRYHAGAGSSILLARKFLSDKQMDRLWRVVGRAAKRITH